MELTDLHKHTGDWRGEYLELDYLIAHDGLLFATTGASMAWVELDFPNGYYDPHTFLPVTTPTLKPSENFGKALHKWATSKYPDSITLEHGDLADAMDQTVRVLDAVNDESWAIFAVKYDVFAWRFIVADIKDGEFNTPSFSRKIAEYVPSHKNNGVGMLIGDGFIQLSWGFQRSDRSRF